MPEVTVNTRKYNVSGSLRDQYYNVTGNTGDTLTVGLTTVKKVNTDGTAVTAYSVAAGTLAGTSVITLTGTLAATNIQVLGN